LAVVTAAAGVDPAVLQARRVVGLYGDPDVTWSVVLAFRTTSALDADSVRARAEELVDAQPHLGAAPAAELFDPADEPAILHRFANEPYADHDPLLRVGLATDGRELVVAAHHGAIDGLGLLGAASALIGEPLESSARGICPEAEPRGFVRRGVRRLGEAVLSPPARIGGDRGAPTERGDWLVDRRVDARRPGSAALVRAAVDLVRRAPVGRRGRLVVSMGLSRRPGSPVPAPDRDTAYVRLRADGVRSVDDARALVAGTPPEPAFPVTDGGGLAPRLTRLLSHRLGATVLVSNLGLVDSAAVESVSFWPVPTGPYGVALGLASSPTSTTLTLRARRGWFSEVAATRLADVAAESLRSAAGGPGQ
jgi:hypothetical protein